MIQGMAKPNYSSQRMKRTPPHVSVRHLRDAVGLTLDALAERIEEETGRTYTRGALSAIELGHRGASTQALTDIAMAFGIPADALRTDYVPRNVSVEDVPA